MKTYRVVNTSTYSKRLILGSRTELVTAKGYIDLELTLQEFALAKRSPDILVSEVDKSSQNTSPTSRSLNKDEFYRGVSGTVAPGGEKKYRPLYEQMAVDIFGLKSRITQLEVRNAELEAMIKACDYDELIENIQNRLDEIEDKFNEQDYQSLIDRTLKALEYKSSNRIAPSELLNVDANPRETNRNIFEKIVNKNKTIREA